MSIKRSGALKWTLEGLCIAPVACDKKVSTLFSLNKINPISLHHHYITFYYSLIYYIL